MRGKLVSALVLAVSLAVPVAALANDTEVGTIGGTVKPVAASDIRLDSETVQLVAYGRFAEVRVDFRFVNDGGKRTVKLGFPFARAAADSQVLPESGFRAWKDGKPLAATAVPGKDGKGDVVYYVHEAVFDKGVSMVTVSYLAFPTLASGGEGIADALPEEWKDYPALQGAFDYWVHTGAGWKGTIRRSLVRFGFSEDFFGFALGRQLSAHSRGLLPPDAVRPDARTFMWDLREYEPTADNDMHVPFVRPYAYYQRTEMRKRMPVFEVTASSRLKLDDQHEYMAEMGADGAPFTAWAEDAAGSGKGEWLKVTFGSPRRVREIRVLPGYQKRADLFAKYNRPKTLKLTFSDGTVTTVHLTDEMGVQRFPVDAKASWAKAEIVDVYRGTTRDETYLSEIEFGSAPAPKFETFEELMGMPASATSTKPVSAGRAAATETSAGAVSVSGGTRRDKASVAYPTDPRSAYFAGAAGCLFLAAAVGVYLLSKRDA